MNPEDPIFGRRGSHQALHPQARQPAGEAAAEAGAMLPSGGGGGAAAAGLPRDTAPVASP